MNSNTARILPPDLVDLVEQFIDGEIRNATTYDNREMLDEDGVMTLHRLAAEIYATGWRGGEQAEFRRQWAQRRREQDAQ